MDSPAISLTTMGNSKSSSEERLGVKLECDCQIVNNDIENRRKALPNAFGADLGVPGSDFDFF